MSMTLHTILHGLAVMLTFLGWVALAVIGLMLARLLWLAAPVLWALARHGWRSWRYGREVRAMALPECGAPFLPNSTKRCVLPEGHAEFTTDKAHADVWHNDGSRVRWPEGHPERWYVETRPIAARVQRGGSSHG